MGFMGAHLHQVMSDGTCAEAGSHGEQERTPRTQECTDAAGAWRLSAGLAPVSARPHRVTRNAPSALLSPSSAVRCQCWVSLLLVKDLFRSPLPSVHSSTD